MRNTTSRLAASRWFRIFLCYVSLATLASAVTAVTPYLVRDINLAPSPDSSFLRNLTTLGGLALFGASQADIGFEPWASDGTAAGTYLLADTCPGPCSGEPRSFFPTGEGRAFFIADGALWVTRGTPASTFRLTDAGTAINSLDSRYSLWAAPQRRLYFAANDGAHGHELWTSDGTAAGTFLVADLVPGADGSGPSDFVLFQNKVFFFARSGSSQGLWSSDGTAAGTRLVKGGTALRNPGGLQPLGNVLVFQDYSPGGGVALWRSDGSSRGTVPLSAVAPGGPFTVLGKRLLFPAFDREHGTEFWSTDGTAAGTRLVKDLCPGACGSQPVAFAALQGRVVFTANDGVHGVEPWLTDGTAAGTRLLADVCPGACSSMAGSSLDGPPSHRAVNLDNRLFLALADGRGMELWSTDGTAAGTRLVKDLCPGACGSQPKPFAALQGRLFFIADDGVHGFELWASNGTARGTVRLTNLEHAHPFTDFDNLDAAALPNAVLFSAEDTEHGRELWRSDGTAAGTGLLVDLEPRDIGGSFPCSLGAANGRLWFTAVDDNGPSHHQIWTSDGTAEGTRAVFDLLDLPGNLIDSCTPFPTRYLAAASGGKTFFAFGVAVSPNLWVTDGTAAGTMPLTGGSFPGLGSQLFPVGSYVLFFAGSELWRSDGTVAGTLPVKPVGSVSAAATFNGRLFFNDDGELWATDGTEAGTALVVDLVPDHKSDPIGLAVFAGRLYFFADTGPSFRPQLWSSDGTAAGTHLALDLEGELPLIPAADRMYLFAAAPGGPKGLWVSDGTAAGTRFLKEVSQSGEAITIGGRLFFASVGGLWTSDGTEEGTRPLHGRDGKGVLGPGWFRAFAGRLVFATFVDGEGTLWQSDGTDAGTFTIRSQVRLGLDLPVTGDRLYFSAYDPRSGTELWALMP